MSEFRKKTVLIKDVTCRSKWFTIYLLGDMHCGHENFMEDECREMVDYISKRPQNGVILLGDLTENVIVGSKGSFYELAIPSPQKQRERIQEILEPIKNQILCSVDGNHSYRSKKAADFCPDGAVSKALGLEKEFLGYGGYLKLKIKKSRNAKPVVYNIWAEHGNGGARTPTGKLTSMLNMVNLRIADAYFCGHHHLKMAQPMYREEINGTSEYRQKIMLACCGAYLWQPEYAIRASYRFDSMGVTKIQLATDRKDIHASL